MKALNSNISETSVVSVSVQPWKWNRMAVGKIMMVVILMLSASLFHFIHLDLIENAREDQRKEKTDFAAFHGLLPLMEQSTEQMQQTLSHPENEQLQVRRPTTKGRVQTPRNKHLNSKDSELFINETRPDLDSLVNNETNEILGMYNFCSISPLLVLANAARVR